MVMTMAKVMALKQVKLLIDAATKLDQQVKLEKAQLGADKDALVDWYLT